MRGIPLLVLSLSLLSCSSPLPPPEPVDDCPLTLTAHPEKVNAPVVTLIISGTCPLPDDTIVRISVRRSVDVLRGDRIVAEDTGAGGVTSEVEKQRFTFDYTAERMGRYTFTVRIPWDLQEKHLVEEVRKKVAPERTWSFEFDVSGLAQVIRSGKHLSDLAPLVESAFDLVAGYERATMSEEHWNQDKDGLVARCNVLRSRPANPNLELYFPLAVRTLDLMFRYLAVNSKDFVFRDGKFSGLRGNALQPLAGGPILIDPNENSPWDGFKRCAKETRALAGREFSLGVIRSLRGNKGVMKPEVAAALEYAEEAPGVRPWAARLQAATLADLEKIEGEIRDLRIDPVK
jgi:hypothetical protein